jgi:hypothetical protein
MLGRFISTLSFCLLSIVHASAGAAVHTGRFIDVSMGGLFNSTKKGEIIYTKADLANPFLLVIDEPRIKIGSIEYPLGTGNTDRTTAGKSILPWFVCSEVANLLKIEQPISVNPTEPGGLGVAIEIDKALVLFPNAKAARFEKVPWASSAPLFIYGKISCHFK